MAKPPPSVLILEDDADTRDLYAEGLAFEGFRVKTAHNGREGIAKARELVPDVVVMDLMSSNIEGMEVIRRIKSDDRTRAIQVIVVTGWVIPTLREQARQVGCDEFICKPCVPHSLAGEIRRLLALAGPARAVHY
jgi:two-component system, cell cycle response regulator DivK